MVRYIKSHKHHIKSFYYTLMSATSNGCYTRVFFGMFWVPDPCIIFFADQYYLEFICIFIVHIMEDQNGKAPLQSTTIDSEAYEEPTNLHALESLPNYLINPSKKDDVADGFMGDVSEEDQETGAGYDINEDANEVQDIDDEMHMAKLFKMLAITELESNNDIKVSDRNMVELEGKIPNDLPENVKIHCVPEDWVDLAPNTEKTEPSFESFDNPGKLSSYKFWSSSDEKFM